MKPPRRSDKKNGVGVSRRRRSAVACVLWKDMQADSGRVSVAF